MTAPVRKAALAQRLKPAGAALVGLLVLGLNVAMLVTSGRFYPFGTMLGCALLFTGGFGAVVGEPEDVYGNRPMWFKAGLVGVGILGLLVGLVLNVELTTGDDQPEEGRSSVGGG
jgi:hypothetical protein